MTAQETQHIVRTLESDIHSKNIKKWLKPADLSTNYNDAAKKRHPGTGDWLLESSVFREWKSHPGGRLLLFGISGCGKTVLTSKILDHLRSERDPSVIILDFFFDSRGHQKRTIDQLLRALAFQLYTQYDTSRAIIDAAFRAFEDGRDQPSTEDLSREVKKMIQTVKGHVLIVLDALDECDARKDLVTELKKFEHLASVSFIATSRPEVEFETLPANWARENIASSASGGIKGDIQSFIKARLGGDDFNRWSSRPYVLKYMETTVTDKAGLM